MKTNSLKYLLVLLVSAEFSLSQGVPADNKTGINLPDEFNDKSSVSGLNVRKSSYEITDKKYRIEQLEIKFRNDMSKNAYSFDFMSSVGSNINFGGLWDHYAVVNFTPQMFIRPLNSVSIYANHSLNCLIPLSGIGDYSKTILLESIAILAFDNSMKFLMNNKTHWISEALSFAVKNILINLLIKNSINKSTETTQPMLQFENYYYSVSITF